MAHSRCHPLFDHRGRSASDGFSRFGLCKRPDSVVTNSPTTGIAGCCARAVSGHAAAPPSSVMNSRRAIMPSMWPSPCEGSPVKGTIPQRKRAVFTLCVVPISFAAITNACRALAAVERREGAPPGISRAHIAYPPIGHGQVDHCVRDAAMAHSGRASPGAISFIRARPDESLRYNFADPSRA